MTAYYNENNAYAAGRLRYLVANNLIAPGDVDERSILEVTSSDLNGYQQCHFFAGIGGWSLAFRYAGVPDSEPFWSGSCPCQPFSTAGLQTGFADERHLWPAWQDIIQQCKPSAIFGEQVTSPLGREWLSRVRIDLENMEYAVGAADLCAAGVGAPHIRQRLYWMAHAKCFRRKMEVQHTNDGVTQIKVRKANVVGGNLPPHEWISGVDGKQRRVKPGVRLLAHGVPNRMGDLHTFGNAIVPQLAAQFVIAGLDAAKAIS